MMARNQESFNMVISTLIMALLAFILFIIGYSKGQHINGMKSAMRMAIEILPLLLFTFIATGMIQVLLGADILSKWIGREAGIRGILIGTIAGALAPGGPYVSLPLVAGFLRAGAAIGTMVAFLTGWSLWSVSRLPMEIGIVGLKFTFIRIASTFFFPPIAGLIAQAFFKNVKLP